MRLARVKEGLPGWKSALLAVAAAILLVLAFPDFDLWFLAWIALVPLLWAVEREKGSIPRALLTGWIFGTAFFFGSCWWLTYAPITYAGFPVLLAYFLFFCVAAAAGLFPAVFAGLLAFLLRRFGSVAMLAAPFVWVATEFARYWITGNNWNALGYSQAFGSPAVVWAGLGGVLLTSFIVLLPQSIFVAVLYALKRNRNEDWVEDAVRHYDLLLLSSAAAGLSLKTYLRRINIAPTDRLNSHTAVFFFVLIPALLLGVIWLLVQIPGTLAFNSTTNTVGAIVAIQPDVPMSGLTYEKWQALRQRHVRLAESALQKLPTDNRQPVTVIFPESPMNFMYETDAETRAFIDGFAARNNVSVIFNSAEPDGEKAFFNSAVMVGPGRGEIAQYDKIFLLPFGESVPAPLRAIVPAFVGSFSYGSEYDLLPLGDAKGGVMICFESHFGELSREYVRNGADVLIEMTNDGYLGPTPVLRQHLANAVFRAVETNRPVLRATNVGITAYINERGEVVDPAPSYTEDVRVWSVAKSDGSQTLYVRWGDWFAWVCVVVTVLLVAFGFARRNKAVAEPI
jgi:apolipoprotein N-acyltransferase